MSDHVCRYCGESFDVRTRYVDHLRRSHDRDELRRIDRRIVAEEADRDVFSRLMGITTVAYGLLPARFRRGLGTFRWPVAPGTVLDLTLLGVALTCFVVIVLALHL